MPSNHHHAASDQQEEDCNYELVAGVNLNLNSPAVEMDDAEINLIEFMQDDVNKKSTVDHQPRVFSCKYCLRKFYSSQALGGHQNAHKRERILAKTSSFMSSAAAAAAGTSSFGRYNYYNSLISSHISLPFHPHNSVLGVQAHSMIRKPAYSSSNHHHHHHLAPPFSLGFARGGSSTQVILPTVKSSQQLTRLAGVVPVGGGWWGGQETSIQEEKRHKLELDLSLKL